MKALHVPSFLVTPSTVCLSPTRAHSPISQALCALICPQLAAPAQGAKPQIKQEPQEGAGESEAAAPPVAKQRLSAAQRRRQRPHYYSSESSDEDEEDQDESEEENDAVRPRLEPPHHVCEPDLACAAASARLQLGNVRLTRVSRD